MRDDPGPDHLRRYYLFQDLTDRQLEQVFRRLHRRLLPAGTTLIAMGEPGETVYVIVTGSVKVICVEEGGRDVVVAILGAGEVIGEMSVLDDVPRSASVVTQEETEVLWMDRASFRECLETMAPMGFALSGMLARRLRLADAQIRTLSVLDVRGRIAHHLLAIAREYGEKQPDGSIYIPFRLTQGDLAEMVGATRVRVNQVMMSWKRSGYCSVDEDHRITILNPARMARCCPTS